MKVFEYDPTERAGLTLDELTAALVSTFDAYNFQVHKSLGDVPMRRWREKAECFPVRTPADLERFIERLGIPDKAVVDYGLDFSSKTATACLSHGISIAVSRPLKPSSKSVMERAFGTLNTRLFHRMPGTTFGGNP